MTRFDEIELEPAVTVGELLDESSIHPLPAPRLKRLLALVTDWSLFAALTLALVPLLPATVDLSASIALAGFVVLMSFYYFVGSWLLWGKTIGGAIFDVRVVSETKPAMPFRSAALRWAGIYLSLATALLGFIFSLPDRLSKTRCVAG